MTNLNSSVSTLQNYHGRYGNIIMQNAIEMMADMAEYDAVVGEAIQAGEVISPANMPRVIINLMDGQGRVMNIDLGFNAPVYNAVTDMMVELESEF